MSGTATPEDGARLLLDCQGVVQGVGARPALRRLADRLRLRGELRNRFGVLQVDLCGPRAVLEEFLAAVPTALPAAARLERLAARWLEAPVPPWPGGVRIAADSALPLGQRLWAPGLSADRAPCAQCLAELADPASRRHRYPFISCCACGPRYTVATALPFCRAHTTFTAFPPCPACAREFKDPADRRFHAETISCPACGPRLRLCDAGGQPQAEGDGALQAACQRLLAGQILALQGVGGFQLLVDASQHGAVARLRHRKRRPSKPFALLLAHPHQMEAVLWCAPAEERALRDPAAPIVLLRRRFASADPTWDPIAPGSATLGVMLPASGLHHLLARAVARPLVATSGNRGGEPLCVTPEEVLERLAGIADAVLTHDLPIAHRLDDSVLQLIDDRPVLLRRARGFVPEPLPWVGPQATSGAGGPLFAMGGPLLAMGGDMKTAPALLMGDQLWLAPHLGDLANAAVQHRWLEVVDAQLDRPSGAEPVGGVTGLVCDAHPGYVSHQLPRPLAERLRLPLITVPHHLAHGLAVLAERGAQPPLLVVACDGLGLADPATPTGVERLWGGELLLIHTLEGGQVGWQRLAALRPFPLPGGERASREPRRCALGLLTAAGDWALQHPGAALTVQAFTPEERELLSRAITASCNAPLSSSLGRFLDGVVSLLGLAQTLSHEGEGGLRWQGAAARGALARQTVAPWSLPLRPCPPHAPCPLPLGRWDWEPVLRALLVHQAAGGGAAEAAWQLERALVRGITRGVMAAAAWSGCRRVALTGGCFQNRALLEGCARGLRQAGMEPLWSERVPCNDGGLALGQAWAAQAGAATYNY